MDRFACYLPGWEMPKNSSEFLTSNYGFITDYLAEAFHYQFSRTNRYEEVNRRIRLGKSVEGRDEKGVKKTMCAFLKILHPIDAPTDEEFEEYVAYALEGRRRVKEQMNKRKPDDEFALVNLSYFNSAGEEIIVYCPESKDVPETQRPVRKDINIKFKDEQESKEATKQKAEDSVKKSLFTIQSEITEKENELKEQHYSIMYGDTGYSYETIVGPYLSGAKEITVEDPYIRQPHQIQNFVRFCEMIIKSASIKKINLITGYDETMKVADLQDKLGELKQSLLELDMILDIQINENIHDREIKINNGWIIKIGRGLDFYQRPNGWYEIGVNDLTLRKCLETKVDIFKG
jgi:ATP-dependent Lon protease